LGCVDGLCEFRVGSLLRRDDKIGLSDKIEGKDCVAWGVLSGLCKKLVRSLRCRDDKIGLSDKIEGKGLW